MISKREPKDGDWESYELLTDFGILSTLFKLLPGMIYATCPMFLNVDDCFILYSSSFPLALIWVFRSLWLGWFVVCISFGVCPCCGLGS